MQRSHRTWTIGETTVKTHVGNILMKLDVRDRAQAVVAAYESGLVVPGGQDPALSERWLLPR